MADDRSERRGEPGGSFAHDGGSNGRRNTDPGAAQRYRTLAAKAREAATRTKDRAMRASYEALATRYDAVARDLARRDPKPAKA